MEAKARKFVNEAVKTFRENLRRKLERKFGLRFRSIRVNLKFTEEEQTVPRQFWPHRERLVPLSPQIPEALYKQAFKTKIPQRGHKLIEGFKNCGNQPISGYGMRQAYDAWHNTIMTTNSVLRKAGVPLQIVKVKAAQYFPENEYRLFTVEPPKEQKSWTPGDLADGSTNSHPGQKGGRT
jgi:hypothetical protein